MGATMHFALSRFGDSNRTRQRDQTMKPKKNNLDSNGFLVGPDGWLNRKSIDWAVGYMTVHGKCGAQKSETYLINHFDLEKALQRAFYQGASWQKLRKQPLRDTK